MATVVTGGLLRELAGFRPANGCAISIYVDFDPSSAPTAPAEKTRVPLALVDDGEEAGRLACPRPGPRLPKFALEADFERIKAWADAEFDRAGARSLAVFASSADGFFRIVPLVEAVADGW